MGPIHPIRVLLVDDYPEFLQVLVDFLTTSSWVRVVGIAVSGDEALEMVRHLQPDMVVTDLAMPGMDGLEATYLMKRFVPAPKVVMVSLHDSQEYRAQADAVGVDGFLSKSDAVAGLLPLIRTLFAVREPE